MTRKKPHLLRFFYWLLLCAWPVAYPQFAGAGTVAATPSTFTEDEAIRLALANSRELSWLAEEIRAREMIADFAGADVNNPEVRAQDISSTYFSDNEDKKFQLGLRWQPPAYGEMGLRKQEETVALWEKKVEWQVRRAELTAEVRAAYAEAIAQHASLEIADQRVVLESRRLAVIEQMVALGQRALLDQIKARKRVSTAKNEAAKLRQLYRNNREKLAALTGVNADPAAASADPPVLDLDRDRLRELARRQRAEMTLIAQRAELASRRSRAENGKRLPWITFVEVDHHFESLDPDWQELRLGLQLPLFNWNGGNCRAAALAVARQDQDAAATAETIERELDAALDDYQLALAEWRSVQSENAAFLPRLASLIDAAHRQGTLPADEVLDLELAELEMRMLSLDAGLEATKAAVALGAAVGVENWEELRS